jgi:hypothetical protein
MAMRDFVHGTALYSTAIERSLCNLLSATKVVGPARSLIRCHEAQRPAQSEREQFIGDLPMPRSEAQRNRPGASCKFRIS